MYINIYVAIIKLKDVMNLRDNKKRFMGLVRGRKREKLMYLYFNFNFNILKNDVLIS